MAHLNPRLLILLLLLAVFGIGGWYIEQQRAQTRSTLSGFFESRPTEVASRLGGRVAQILVQEGDSVHAGQPTIIFEAEADRAETEAKQAQARQAQAQLREVENGPRREDIRRQEAVVAELTAALARQENGPLPEEIAAARARFRQAQALYEKTRAGARPQEIAQARAAERTASARLAEAERGPTAEAKAEAKARLDAATAQETLARKEMARTASLYRQGAISHQALDRAQADLWAAEAKRQEMAEAYQRAEIGTPPEELEQAREMHRQAQAALALVLAGSRKEDIVAARNEAEAAWQNLRLLLRGTRPEDIRAARARLIQAQAALAALRAGSRKEQIAQAQAAAKAAQDTARSSRKTLEERTVRAPRDGIIERIPVAVGDLIAPGTMVIRMTDPTDLWIRVYVPEAKLALVSVGDAAELRVDGISDSVPAQVESIATRGEFTPANLQTPDERGKQVFAVRLRLKQPEPRVKAGMYATATHLGRLL